MTKRERRSTNTVMTSIGRSSSQFPDGIVYILKRVFSEKAIRTMNTKLQITEYRMEHIDCVYYMNLDHRTDRRAQIESELDKLEVPESKRVRIPGIYTPGFGILGCGFAHKRTMETFLASPHKTCLIFEDDFEFTVDMDYVRMLLNSIFEEKIQFDCIMLAGVILDAKPTKYPFLLKVNDAHTASGYIVTKDFAPTLLKSYTDSTKLLEETYVKTGEKNISYHNDIYWKRYQPSSKWFILNPRIGEQRQSYSDNLERDLKYGF